MAFSLKGTGFSPYIKAAKKSRGFGLKGTGFSPYIKAPKVNRGL
jgi:hypothetical protein